MISNNIISNNGNGTGGGIYCYNGSSPIITYNTISNNTNTDRGGAIFSVGGAGSITHNTISNNSSGSGGGIYATGSETIADNIISNNSAGSGGGIFCSGQTKVSNNFISNNSAGGGGGLACYMDNSTIRNNIISNNTASGGGGAIWCGSYSSYSSNPTLTNNTISNNSAQQGGALFCTSLSASATPNFRNNILWGDSAGTGNEVYINEQTSKPNFYYCDVMGGSAAFGLNANVFYLGTYTFNINSDPQFVTPSGGAGTAFDGLIADWSLQASSPCIDAGDPVGTYPVSDIAGNLRVVGTRIDIGAYENQGSVGVGNLTVENLVTVYPNPFSSYTSLKSAINLKDATLRVYNSFGQAINQINNLSGQTIIFHRDKLPSGLYFIRLTQDNKTIATDKLIITDN